MMALFVLLGAVLVGAFFWMWLRALLDVGLAAVATTVCVAKISYEIQSERGREAAVNLKV
jgi:hypothetical protein